MTRKELKNVQSLIGKVVAGLYPRHNFRGVISSYEDRRVLVTRVRVIAKEPLDSITTTLNPLLRRGRVLIIGIDQAKNAERSFYLDSFHVWEAFDFIPSEKRSA